jgi:hypothetical protein
MIAESEARRIWFPRTASLGGVGAQPRRDYTFRCAMNSGISGLIKANRGKQSGGDTAMEYGLFADAKGLPFGGGAGRIKDLF